MKQMLVVGLACLLLIGCGGEDSSRSVVPPAGDVLTAAWGDSRDSVKSAFSAQGLQMVRDSMDLVYSGGSFEGYAVDQWVLTFSEAGRFSSAVVSISPDTTGSDAITQGLKTWLTGRLGEPIGPLMWKKDASGDRATTYSLMGADPNRVMLRIEGPIEHIAAIEMRTETPTVK